MLKRIRPEKENRIPNPAGAAVRIADAAYPAPFASELEFNSPVHESWNIVHIGMQIPQAHQIYVCADNCMRGVVLTAAEMNAIDRFSSVVLEEKDLYEGNLEDITIEGISDCIRKLPARPPVVLVFLVCLHHFVGTDTGRVYRELEARFPDIQFIRAWMDPIMQKTGLTPDQKLRKAVLDPFYKGEDPESRNVSLLCDNFPLEASSDLYQLITGNGYQLRQVQDCKTYQEFLDLQDSCLVMTRSFMAEHGVRRMVQRLKRRYLYLPPAMSYEEITEELACVCRSLGMEMPDVSGRVTACEEALARALDVIGSTPVSIDNMGAPRPLGLARLLISHGFHVTCVYLDAINEEEREDFLWLRQHQPDLVLAATMQVKMRFLHGENRPDLLMGAPGGKHLELLKPLAIGPKAAWFADTAHFVNLVEMNGMWGFDAIIRLADMMIDAYLHEKDTRDIVPRKGFGCGSCI